MDDEAIQAGENMLLTFTRVRNEVGKNNNIFAQATATVQDMAAAFGGDAVSNSKILGKALNDPIKGVSALTRVGVQFTDGQKEQIKTMVESGNILGAQKIILGELTKQTEGSAEAQATAGMKAKVAWDNLKESVGTALLPVLDRLEVFFVNKIVPALYSTAAGAKRLLPVFKQVARFALGAFAGLLPIIGAFAAAIQDKIAAALPRIASAAKAAIPAAQTFFGQLQTAANNLAPIVASLVSEFVSFLPTVISLATTVASALGPALVAVTGFLGEHATTVKAVAAAIVAMVAAYKVAQLATVAFTAVQAALDAVLAANPIGIVVLALVGLAAGLVYAYKHSETFRNGVDALGRTFKAVFEGVKKVVSVALSFISAHWRTIIVILGGPLGLAVALITKHWDKIKAGAIVVLGWIRDHWPAIKAVITGPFETAKTVIGAVWTALRQGASRVKEVITGVFHAISEALQGSIDKAQTLLEKLHLLSHEKGTAIKPGGRVAADSGGVLGVGTKGDLVGTVSVGRAGVSLHEEVRGLRRDVQALGGLIPAGVGDVINGTAARGHRRGRDHGGRRAA